MKLLVTGGAGFIGSCFVRMMVSAGTDHVINLDKLTYAGNLDNVASVSGMGNYEFVHGDIADRALVDSILAERKPDAIVNFAAESHVDRSILAPDAVFETNLRGTFTLLEAARKHGVDRFLHVSTDEVYGSLEDPLEADEQYPLCASSPYSAAKAGSDLLVLSYYTTYKLPVLVTRASNNYGPFQFPEKLIPLMICNAMAGKTLPVYGDGLQIRDWLFVEDHCRAIRAVLSGGRLGQVYNIAGNASVANIEVVKKILAATGQPESLIRYVTDRPGHDRRYALSSGKLTRETGWAPQMNFETGLAETVRWYRENTEWTRRVQSGEYQAYYAQNYAAREVLR
jgi:dTDP-glucose 4,6-dehydratase